MNANIISISEIRMTVISETVTCKALSQKRLIEFLFLMAMMFKPFVDKGLSGPSNLLGMVKYALNETLNLPDDYQRLTCLCYSNIIIVKKTVAGFQRTIF